VPGVLPSEDLKMYYIGIDPGASGCVAVLHNDFSVSATCRMTNTAFFEVVDFLRGYTQQGTPHVVLEKVASSPQMGVRSAFTFGQSYGRIEGALVALEIAHSYVRPQDWQASLGIPKRGKKTQPEHKRTLAEKARALYPKESITADVADALLIAHWCAHHCPDTQRNNHDTN
jgi:Holliday junction resolvasome RuvABC endonuclease subunit